ncbi:predicted protein [Chaetoceros tenuissimus]|nr:predicted protein [Chaetoceros tenuissimus]
MFIKGRPEGIDLHRNSVHLQAFNEETKMEIALRFRQLEENDCDQPPEEIDYKRKVSRGNKYFVHFSNEDPLLQSAPRLIEPRDKIVENKRNKGSLIISHHSMQRLHVWQDGDFPLNAVTKDGCEDFCQDQFWIFHPVEAPKLPGEMYDPDQKVFTINSKKSKERLYAKLKEYGTSQQDFGLVPNEVDIDDSQKWQILEGHLVDNEGSKGKYYYIVNAHSDRFLGILSEGDAPSSKLNCVIAAIAEEACLDTHSMKKFQWIVAPWKILLNQITSTNKLPEEKDKDFMELPEDVKKFVPDKKIILKRSSLPAKTLLDNGGITISNPYPYIYTVRWSGEDRGETLMPNSSVELPNHQKDTSKAEIIIAYELTEVKVEVEPKQKYNLHYGEDDPFRLGLPKVLSPDVITKEKPKPREGYYLIQKDSDGNLLRLGGISRYSFVSCSHRNPKAYIMDQIRETEASSTKNESISVGNCLSCFHSDPNAYIDQIWEIEPLSNKGEFRITTTFRIDKSQNRMYLDCGNERASSFDDSSCIWKIDSKSQERGDGLIWYSIKNKYGYLHAKDGEECCLKQDFDECQWAIIEKSEINSEQTRKGLHHFGDTISFKDMSTLLEDYRSSHKWRIAGINCANSTWDVKSIVFYGPDGNRIDIDANNAMSSGQCGGLGPSSAFSDTIDKFWSGRPNTSGEIYIGMNFETKVKVRSVKVTMHNENIPKKVQLQFLYHDYWVTIAENAGPINRKETIRIEVKQINNAKFPFSQVKLEAPGSNEVPAKDWVVGSLFYPQDGLQLHHDWPNDDLSHGCIRIQTRESDELNKMINSTDGKYKGGSFTMKKPFPLLDFVKTTGNIYFEFIVQEIGETIQGRELFECLCDIKFALTKSSGERPGKEDAIGFSFALENTFDGWDDYEEERYQSSKCFAEVPYDSILIPYHSFVANKCYAIKIEPDWKNSKVAFSMKHYNEVKTVEVILPKTESGEAKFNGINGCCIEGKLVNSNSLGDFNIAIRNMEIDFDLPFLESNDA